MEPNQIIFGIDKLCKEYGFKNVRLAAQELIPENGKHWLMTDKDFRDEYLSSTKKLIDFYQRVLDEMEAEGMHLAKDMDGNIYKKSEIIKMLKDLNESYNVCKKYKDIYLLDIIDYLEEIDSFGKGKR
jgi:hypothetical protein